ncbi:hypothetical protein [Mycobacterium sp.]|uniref:hypothetical protein n=1 Tax=Mycobacterium sp. TaxID=1785 RepID=UPI003A5C3C65
MRNKDGDEVVEPPDHWLEPDIGDSLDERLAAEVPDDLQENRPSEDARDRQTGSAVEVVSDDELDRIDPTVHGRVRGQIDGTPEDGSSFFDVPE